MEAWLPLTDYSSKYKISVSTLRRRIKTDDIKYHFQDGKYFIFDEQPSRTEPYKGEQFRTDLNMNSFKSSPSLNSLETASINAASIEADLIFDEEILNGFDTTTEPVEIDKKKPAVPAPVTQLPKSSPATTLSHAYNPDFLENLKKSANS